MDNRIPPLSIHIPLPSRAPSDDQSQRTPFQSPAHTTRTPTTSTTPPRHPRNSRTLLQGGSSSPTPSNTSSAIGGDSQRRRPFPNGIASPIQPNIRRSSNASSVDWSSQASSTIRPQESEATAVGMIPTSLSHETLVLFTKFPTNIDGLILEKTDDSIAALMEHFGLPNDSVFYNADLTECGLTKLNEDPDIGPEAFNSVLTPPGNGESRALDPHGVALQVALTIAHELSHVLQFETFAMIDLEGREREVNQLKMIDKIATQLAHPHQIALFETLGYHSEVVNITAFINKNRANLSETKLAELKSLCDVSVHQRDNFFGLLPQHIAEHVVNNDIEGALKEIMQDVPEQFIRHPEPRDSIESNISSS